MLYYYQQAKCETNKYFALYPVSYEEINGALHKVEMSCSDIKSGKCKISCQGCHVFRSAPETIPLDQSWKLYSKKL